jgi:hypothetical protein
MYFKKCPMPARKQILKSYAEWTVLSALRSGAPIKSKKNVYPLINKINFTEVLDRSKGPITHDQFESWHKDALETAICANSKLKGQYGWAAKIINIYLKTYCYIGDGGRVGIRECLHPPIDSGLWKGVKRKFPKQQNILEKSHAVTSISSITTHDIYLKLISGFREASKEMNCSLIEIEQLWEGAGKKHRNSINSETQNVLSGQNLGILR